MAGRPSYPTSRLEYALPPELIAQHPATERRASRLLHVDVANGSFSDRSFADLPGLLPEGSLIVMNNSRVIPARTYGRRQSGGRVEVLYHGRERQHVYRVLMKSRAPLPAGEMLVLPEGWQCELLEPKQLDGSLVRIMNAAGAVVDTAELHAWLDRNGIMPLPPYIHRDTSNPDEESGDDRERYQTVYAQDRGSVAAPTAGLHFDDAMLAELRGNGHAIRFVTLHVGMGTFAPLRVDDLAQHSMHGEDFSVELPVVLEHLSALKAGRPVMAVGTTSLRVLHTIVSEGRMPQPDAVTLHGSTHTFIYPGQPTVAADLLLTNFHLPKSTLLALVYAFGGEELMQRVYNHAVEQRYRFFSYGDCMLIDRRNSAT
ncbi:MAG: tRNA preQ1(34) S-adenosylmethionine ribosyltransferase-isomerase QueA [Planctomycetales bacterium]|nr:tRNA preQ1(34) S-adenosylmethionine ribosyltransferase-isomerase QueA [bacterium]UNM07345.1 MAG: tRNA preQ1(34) S-adenosylmethionine ribosyltransferase-isomerase QueA [Planctomycetales bacterium]